MLEFFSNSLLSGFWLSSGMGKGIVLIQLCSSVVMVAFIIGKWRELGGLVKSSRRAMRDILGSQHVLDHRLTREDNAHSPIENIYWGTCDRLIRVMPPAAQAQVRARQLGVPASLSTHEVALVESKANHILDEESLRVEKGMGIIATVVSLAPMLGLLGTVWGVLDAFADMGAAGSATIATMAPAISSALVTTVVGLLVAIPGVAAATYLNAEKRGLLADMDAFVDDFMGRIGVEFQESGRLA